MWGRGFQQGVDGCFLGFHRQNHSDLIARRLFWYGLRASRVDTLFFLLGGGGYLE